MSTDVRERLADVQHEIWAHWMRYMFTCGQFGLDGTWHMPAFKAERWQRQMDTPYSALTERERESDREQADKVILKIRHLLEGAILADVYGPRLEAAELELSHLRPEWKAVTAERDALCAQLAAATARAEAAEAKLLTLQVDRSKTVKLRDETDSVIWALKPEDVPGAINWGDLGVCEVQEIVNDMRRWYRVIIEEADPNNPALHAAVLAGLLALGWDTNDIEIETAW